MLEDDFEEDRDAYYTGEHIKAEVFEIFEELRGEMDKYHPMFSDVLRTALESVDWLEVARGFVEEWEHANK